MRWIQAICARNLLAYSMRCSSAYPGGTVMKIDSADKHPQITSPASVQPAGEIPEKGDFAKVLGETVQHASATSVGEQRPVHSLRGPDPLLRLEPRATPWEHAHGLINALEKYQQLLGDASADMKAVAPAVEKMRRLSEQVQPMLDHMPQGHPVTEIVQETLVHISKEIERFNAGYYVDNV